MARAQKTTDFVTKVTQVSMITLVLTREEATYIADVMRNRHDIWSAPKANDIAEALTRALKE